MAHSSSSSSSSGFVPASTPSSTVETSPDPTASLLSLAEFPPVTYDAWKALVEAELKGAPFEKRMFSKSAEGITLRPIYRAGDTEALHHWDSFPGFAPFVRGGRASGHVGHPWEVSQEITAASPGEFNDLARAGLQRGLTALNIVLDRATRNGADPDWARAEDVGAGGLSLCSLDDLARALDGVDLETVPLFIRSGASGMPMAAFLVALAQRRGCDPTRLRGCIEVDPLGVLSHEGSLPQSLEEAYREMAALTAWAAEAAPNLQTLCVHSRAWHESGGHAVQELAFTLATAIEYLRAMNQRGLPVEVVAPRIRFAYTVGVHFFTEIAKLRAARLLWSRLVAATGASEAAQRASLHVRTSLFNKTRFDVHTNILRTTVEAFAGILGGCDSLQVGPFDEVLHPAGEFAQRVARNQQWVLREECHLARVIDPAGGSWYVESLTDELARRAWTLFQEIEKRGGMAAAMRSGWPQQEVTRTCAERLDQVAKRRARIIGTNAYANPTEPRPEITSVDTAAFHRRRVQQVAATRTKDDDHHHEAVLQHLTRVVGIHEAPLFNASVSAALAGATLGELTRAIRIEDTPDAAVTPVRLTRAASGFEALRFAVEAHAATHGTRPAVFLANFGPPSQHRSRADFARSFFEIAGATVINPPGFATPAAAAAAAALEAGASTVCICSTDETYPSLVPALIPLLREARPGVVVILAGYPEEQVDAHKAAGVDAFIHLRADVLEVLTEWLRRLGVNV